MFIALLYHRVSQNRFGNSLATIENHFRYLSENKTSILPKESSSSKKQPICLTFDDAYFDFYHYIFPLLKKYGLKAVLAVPTDFILDSCTLAPEKRVTSDLSEEKLFSQKGRFCSWEEIIEMANSGSVEIASHGKSHTNLLKSDNLEDEIILSKNIIEKRIGKKVSSFVYPFGKFNAKVHKLAKKNYTYIFRIGSSCNFSWNPTNQMIYRIPADNLPKIEKILSKKAYVRYLIKYFLNRLRGR